MQLFHLAADTFATYAIRVADLVGVVVHPRTL